MNTASAGDAPHGWILLRGLVREARHWEGLPEKLALVLQAPVWAVDLPGNGARWHESSPTRIDAMVEALRDQLVKAERPGPHRVLALSLGGMVALRWAQRYPAEVAGLVLVNASLRGVAPFYERLRPRQYGRLLLALGPVGHERRERLILKMTTRLQQDPDSVARRHAQWQAQAPVSKANLLRQLLAAARGFAPPEAAPPCPTLLLASRADQMVSCRCSQRMAERWGWPIVYHASAGHDLPLDAPDWVIEQIRAWLAASGGAPLAQQPGRKPHPHQPDQRPGKGAESQGGSQPQQ
ncbi:alpha/beta fold hydrolase [Halomonas sp. E14]|uniref:alpha/beta fold hydrolase n=1 Tax=Halomonas sp. E14 TaxID=3397245 RepID=UPI00403EA4B8